MDPDQALRNARESCRHWHEGERGDRDLVAFDELVSAFEALDSWLSRGGFLPDDWEKSRPTTRVYHDEMDDGSVVHDGEVEVLHDATSEKG